MHRQDASLKRNQIESHKDNKTTNDDLPGQML
jgi:hypothetical protein